MSFEKKKFGTLVFAFFSCCIAFWGCDQSKGSAELLNGAMSLYI